MATSDEISLNIINAVFQEMLCKEENGKVIDENIFTDTFTECLHSELDYFMETEYTEDLKLKFDLMTLIKLYRDTYGGLDDLFKLPEFIIHKRLIYNAFDDDIMQKIYSDEGNLFELYKEFKQKERGEGERAEGEETTN